MTQSQKVLVVMLLGVAVLGFVVGKRGAVIASPVVQWTLTGAEVEPPSEPVSVSWRSVRGRVIYPPHLAIPGPKPIAVTVDRNYILSQGPIFSDDLIVDPATRGIKNAVVWLRADNTDRVGRIPSDRIFPEFVVATPTTHEVEHRFGQFHPRITLVREGDSVVFRNRTPITIAVAVSADQFPGNSWPVSTDHAIGPLKYERPPIPFKCHIHPWMSGQLRVFDHPYFALTDEKGRFELTFCPVGKWRIVYAHENGFHRGAEGRFGYPIEIPADGIDPFVLQPVEFEFPK
jgi:hypothetical protein